MGGIDGQCIATAGYCGVGRGISNLLVNRTIPTLNRVNFLLRKTTLHRLLVGGVDFAVLVQISGHKWPSLSASVVGITVLTSLLQRNKLGAHNLSACHDHSTTGETMTHEVRLRTYGDSGLSYVYH